jgi:hypothetical protein
MVKTLPGMATSKEQSYGAPVNDEALRSETPQRRCVLRSTINVLV